VDHIVALDAAASLGADIGCRLCLEIEAKQIGGAPFDNILGGFFDEARNHADQEAIWPSPAKPAHVLPLGQGEILQFVRSKIVGAEHLDALGLDPG